MKLVACLLAACLCACGSQPKQEVKSAANDTFYPPSYIPPNSFPELTVLDTRSNPVQPVIVVEDEQQKYEESVKRIETEIRDEGLRLQMYSAVYGSKSKEFKKYLKDACSVDVLLDTRGDHHRKPYCNTPGDWPSATTTP